MGSKPLPVALALALASPSPAAAAQAADPPAPVTGAAAEASPCAGASAERASLQAERAQVSGAIADIALGKRVKKRKVSGGDVAAGVAGAAASVLLPFGVGALLGAGARAAASGGKKKPRPAPPQVDVQAMIDRVNAIDVRLKALEACGR